MVVIFFLLIFLALIGAVITCYFEDIRPYKKAVETLKVGDKYTYTIEDDDPFVEPTILDCTIVEIRYGKDNVPYVKYEFTDGSESTMRFDRFFYQYNM